MSMVHTFAVRIYYEDTDFSGNVYHAAYLKFMERARTEFLRDRGVHHSSLLAERNMAFAVRDMQIRFERPARIDDLLQVRTFVKDIRGARMVLEQTVSREGEMLVGASVTIASISLQGRPVRLGADIIERLSGTP